MRLSLLVACLWLATSPLWGKIVFYSKRYGNYDIYTMNSDGSNQTRLTFNEAADIDPTWSPNGRQIAFASYRAGEKNSDIYVMDADGKNQRQLTHHPGTDAYPEWSPDGSQITFTSDRSTDENQWLNIFIMDADGGNVKQLSALEFDQKSRWSPDGEWILFTAGEIFAIRPDGTGLWQVSVPKPNTGMYLGDWSPDGNRILYTEALNLSVNTSFPVIATLAKNGRAEVISWKRIKVPRMALDQVTFSADGKSILFSGKKGFVLEGEGKEPWNIYRFGLIDKKLIQLTDQLYNVGAEEWNPQLPVSSQGVSPMRWGELKSD